MGDGGWRSGPDNAAGLLVVAAGDLTRQRKNEALAQVIAGFGVSTAIAGRYVSEVIELLAECAPGLHEALRELPLGGFVILDGTLIATDRIAADEPYYSMKHRRHGKNVQVVASPDGMPLWFSRALPGRTRPDTSPSLRPEVPPGPRTRCDPSLPVPSLLVLADRAYRGAGATIRTPYYGPNLSEEYAQFNRDHAQFNRDHARLRAPGERAFARLKQWRILRKARRSTNRIGRTVAAIHAIEIIWRSG